MQTRLSHSTENVILDSPPPTEGWNLKKYERKKDRLSAEKYVLNTLKNYHLDLEVIHLILIIGLLLYFLISSKSFND